MKNFPPAVHHRLHKAVVQAIRARGLLEHGQKVLIAVSGGPDSVAMLSILHAMAPEWNLALTVVHCNYGLRGAESNDDARFVTRFCRQLSIPCLVTPLTVTRREAGASSSLQARAREARYRLFRTLAGELGTGRVAIGHTADDQAETVLLRMLRGAGLRGLSAMSHIRDDLFIRPLLGFTRQDIMCYLKSTGLSYRNDSSNAKPLYLRNRVRHEVIPILQSMAPHAVRILARQADLLRDDDRVLDALTARRLARAIRSRDSSTLVLDRTALLAEPVALQRRMLRQALQALSPSRTPRSGQIRSLLESLSAARSGSVWKVGAVTIACESVRLSMTVAPPAGVKVNQALQFEREGLLLSTKEVTIASLPATISWAPTGESLQFRRVTMKRGHILLQKKSPGVALFDAERLLLPLRIRTWREGDWFCPVGMNGRRKKLQDYFTDAKLPRSMRKRMPLLLSPDGLAWIVGQRIDARVAAGTSTTRFIVARVRQLPRRKGAL